MKKEFMGKCKVCGKGHYYPSKPLSKCMDIIHTQLCEAFATLPKDRQNSLLKHAYKSMHKYRNNAV